MTKPAFKTLDLKRDSQINIRLPNAVKSHLKVQHKALSGKYRISFSEFVILRLMNLF